MTNPLVRLLVATSCLSLGALSPARAQWAVIDAPAIVQLVQEVQTLEQQLQTARDQLGQARRALDTMTGNRGMERLLSGTPRNYLPANWSQLDGFSTTAAGAPNADAVLTPAQLSLLAPADRQQIMAARRSVAVQRALAQTALVNASNRFASLQNLIAAIPAASDQKGILDLQARIGAELGMLQNEQTKLQILHRAALAQDAVNRQQEREQVIAEHGRFESRFQPTP